MFITAVFLLLIGLIANEVMPIQLGNSTSNITVKNNLCYAPNSANALTSMVSGTAKSGFIALITLARNSRMAAFPCSVEAANEDG